MGPVSKQAIRAVGVSKTKKFDIDMNSPTHRLLPLQQSLPGLVRIIVQEGGYSPSQLVILPSENTMKQEGPFCIHSSSHKSLKIFT